MTLGWPPEQMKSLLYHMSLPPLTLMIFLSLPTTKPPHSPHYSDSRKKRQLLEECHAATKQNERWFICLIPFCYFFCISYRIFALLDPVFNPVQADGTRNKKIGKLFLNLKVNQMIRFQYFWVLMADPFESSILQIRPFQSGVTQPKWRTIVGHSK